MESTQVAFFKELDALDVYSDSRRRRHVDGNAAEREAVSTKKRARRAPAGGDGAAADGEAPRKPGASVMTKFKIVVATYQIATSCVQIKSSTRLQCARNRTV